MQYPGLSAIGGAYRRPSAPAAGAGCRRSLSRSALEVVAERQRRQRVRALPRRAERNRPGVTAVDAQRLVRILEAAVPAPAEDDVAAAAQDGEVDVAVAVDVEGVRAGDRRQIGDRRRPGVRSGARRPPRSRCGTARPARCRRRRTVRRDRRRHSRTPPLPRRRRTRTHRRRCARCPPRSSRRRTAGTRRRSRTDRPERQAEATSAIPTTTIASPSAPTSIHGVAAPGISAARVARAATASGPHVGHRRIEPHRPATV